MPSNRVGQDSGGSIEEYPGSSAGPGVVQQHVFKNITTHSLTNEVKSYNPRGGSRSDKYIHNWGGGGGGGVRDSKGVWGIAPLLRSGAKPQPLVCFCVYLA